MKSLPIYFYKNYTRYHTMGGRKDIMWIEMNVVKRHSVILENYGFPPRNKIASKKKGKQEIAFGVDTKQKKIQI